MDKKTLIQTCKSYGLPTKDKTGKILKKDKLLLQLNKLHKKKKTITKKKQRGGAKTNLSTTSIMDKEEKDEFIKRLEKWKGYNMYQFMTDLKDRDKAKSLNTDDTRYILFLAKTIYKDKIGMATFQNTSKRNVVMAELIKELGDRGEEEFNNVYKKNVSNFIVMLNENDKVAEKYALDIIAMGDHYNNGTGKYQNKEE